MELKSQKNSGTVALKGMYSYIKDQMCIDKHIAAFEQKVKLKDLAPKKR
jgi:hypothetical protein